MPEVEAEEVDGEVACMGERERGEYISWEEEWKRKREGRTGEGNDALLVLGDEVGPGSVKRPLLQRRQRQSELVGCG